MKIESHGAAGRDMIVGCDRLIENGKDCVYGSGKSSGRIRITEKDIGSRMVEIESGEAKLWGWNAWFGMWTTSGFPAGDLISRNPDRALGDSLRRLLNPFILPLSLLFDRLRSLLGANRKRGGCGFSRGSGHGEGCW